MDNRLVLTFLFVTLSWISVGTYAESTTVAAVTMTMTTAADSNMTTTAADNMTMTTAADNMTMTTAADNNMTTTAAAANNMTTTAAAANNMTTTAAAANNNMTTTAAAANNMTTTAAANTTMAPTTVAAATTAEVPPLTPNTTVESLATPVSSTGCGTEQICAAEPSSCDPSGNGSSCFFLGAKRQNGQNFEFSLSGESEGYIAATLSTDDTLGNNDTTYVCANNNGAVQFFGAHFNDGQLMKQTLNVNSVKGKVEGNRIQCTFAATVPSPATRAGDSNFALGISTGPFNATSGDLGAPTTLLRSPVVNLANPAVNITNQATNTTNTNTTSAPATTTTSHGITIQQSLTQALLITVGVLGLAML